MITDKELIQWYYKGFKDELNGCSTIMSQDNFLELRAYEIGANHAALGDEIKSFDNLTEEEILKIIKSGI
jgi:hypothetical protein